MRRDATVAVIIPALNEQRAIGKVLAALPNWVDETIVVDNGSEDGTADVARRCGARVTREPRRGYGSACLAGIAVLERPDVVVFLDGDYSDRPGEMDRLVDPILDNEADLVIGSRVLGDAEAGSLTPQARFGNWLACRLMWLCWGVCHTDLGPFRAIRFRSLVELGTRDLDYGWTVQMQVKAQERGLRVREVPVSYHRRIGASKISGTVMGAVGAGVKILATIFRAAVGPAWRAARRIKYEGRRTKDERGSETGTPSTSPLHPSSFVLHPSSFVLHRRLVVFTRYPEAGTTKTRLIPALGPEGAAELQRRMTGRTLQWARDVSRREAVQLEVRYEGGSAAAMRACFGAGPRYRRQGAEDLGRRMFRTFTDAQREGVDATVIVGTDCPDLDGHVVRRAFRALGRHDLVLGPATDGGYTLIGLRRPIQALFSGPEWGTGAVLEETLATARRLELSVALLEELADVDRPEDLPIWQRADHPNDRISVIVPVLNEADHLAAALDMPLRLPGTEVIVVDGGSDDRTVEVAADCGATVVSAPAGRAAQMNVGARHAGGEILVFLHGDTCLPGGFDDRARQVLARPDVAGGAFRVRIDSDRPSLRAIECLIALRNRFFHMPYGDQAIFTRRDTFRSVGGFPEVPIMEDFLFIQKLKRLGRVAIAQAPATTSARRWLRHGVVRTTLANQAAIVGYLVGIGLERIARWYARASGRCPAE